MTFMFKFHVGANLLPSTGHKSRLVASAKEFLMFIFKAWFEIINNLFDKIILIIKSHNLISLVIYK